MTDERWDCHEHKDKLRVSDAATIYHDERGQLCQMERHYDCILAYPIRFESRGAAHKWIQSGCIADLQEGLCNLGVGFTNLCFKRRETEEL